MDELPIVGPTVDLSQAPAINYKRTLAFLNHFVTHTVRFLNKFSGVCEQKLADLQVRTQRLEITLSILESKLSSIPGLDQVATTEMTSTTSQPAAEQVSSQNTSQTKEPVQNSDDSIQEIEPEKPEMTISKDPRYAEFFKMVMVGVPVQAVKGKMSAEGLNPDLLDNPDAPAPAGGMKPDEESDLDDDNSDDGVSSSGASSFSDEE